MRRRTILFRAAVLAMTALVPARSALARAAGQRPDPPERPDATPAGRMARRFPQPVRVGFLVGLPVLDERGATVGRVREVVRAPDGQVRLIVRAGGVLGLGTRPVALPVEVVGMLGANVALLDISGEEMARAPDWTGGDGRVLAPEEEIRVALTRR